jgi:hypothetical protein
VKEVEDQTEIRVTREDFEYFRLKPAKNWRIRQKFAGERTSLSAQISCEHDRAIVFRPMASNDGSYTFFKATITTGQQNDLVDPWMYLHNGAIRASLVWRRVQNTEIDHSYSPLLDKLEEDALGDNGFEEWCLVDIERTARLSSSLHAESSLLKKFSGELGDVFRDSGFDEIKQKLVAANMAATDPSLLEQALPLLAGWKITNFWGTHPGVTLKADEVLLSARSDDGLDDLAMLPSPTVLLDTSAMPASLEDGIHGYLFTNFHDRFGTTIFQVGELGIDGRIAFIEYHLVDGVTAWKDIHHQATHSDVITNAEVFSSALYVLLTYALHRKNFPTDTRRCIGVEILQKNHPLAPKEITMTAPAIAQKPPTPVSAPRTPISEILARIEAAYEDRQRLHYERITELRYALEAYADAAKNDLVIDFAKRNGVDDAGDLQAPDAALHLSDLVDRLPEMGGKESVRPPKEYVHQPSRQLAVEAGEDAQTTDGDLPRIRARLNGAGTQLVVLIGGRKVPAKMPWLTSVLGYEPEWISTEDESGSKESQTLVGRMERREFSGVIFFQAFMSHKQTEPLLEAGRTLSVPVIAGGRAGQGEITRALFGIERML